MQGPHRHLLDHQEYSAGTPSIVRTSQKQDVGIKRRRYRNKKTSQIRSREHSLWAPLSQRAGNDWSDWRYSDTRVPTAMFEEVQHGTLLELRIRGRIDGEHTSWKTKNKKL